MSAVPRLMQRLPPEVFKGHRPLDGGWLDLCYDLHLMIFCLERKGNVQSAADLLDVMRRAVDGANELAGIAGPGIEQLRSANDDAREACWSRRNDILQAAGEPTFRG